MTDYIVIGSGSHAALVIDTIESRDGCRVLALVEDVSPVGTIRHRHIIAGRIDDIYGLSERIGCNNLFVAVGDNKFREHTWLKLNHHGFEFPSLVHPLAFVSSFARLGVGAYVGPGAFVGSNSAVGSFGILSSNSILNHDSTLHACAHLDVNSTVRGHAVIGERALIGAGAIIMEHVEVGPDCKIAAGALLSTNIKT